MVPPDSTGISRVPAYSGTQPGPYSDFAYGTLTPYGRPFQTVRLSFPVPHAGPHNPGPCLHKPVWALPLSLAATQGISVDFSSSGYLDVSVPRVGSALAVTGSLQPGFPIRTPPDQSPLAAPRRFSQLATSFIADLCLGIHTCALIRLTNSNSSPKSVRIPQPLKADSCHHFSPKATTSAQAEPLGPPVSALVFSLLPWTQSHSAPHISVPAQARTHQALRLDPSRLSGGCLGVFQKSGC
jgi:hypothetical protein